MRDTTPRISIAFYKESKYTNLDYLKKHPNQFYKGDWLAEIKSSEMMDYLWICSFNIHDNQGKIKKTHEGSSIMSHQIKQFYNLEFNCVIK